VNSENFESSILVGNANIDFTVETTSTTERWVDGVWSVGCTNHNDLTTALNTVHKGKKLSDDTLLDLALGLLSVGGNRIDLINEENGWLVLLALFEGLSQVLFGLTLHF
jgi:hypothetical protein